MLIRDRASSTRLVSFLLAWLGCSLLTGDARSDEVSGTYTGQVVLRGNYYWENSTRVVAPSAGVNLATPSGVRVDGQYLLDAITSASQATGVEADVAFTEKRNEVQGGVGYEFDLGAQQLDLTLRGRYSTEPDYKSRGVGFSAALSLDDRNTTLRLNGYFWNDKVYRKERFAPPERPNELTAREATYVGNLNVLSLGVAWEQLLNAASTLTVGHDFSFLAGFQANPYRPVLYSDGAPTREEHPDRRVRNASYAWFAHYLKRTRSAIRVGYRLYYDSWELLAHAPELRLHQEFGRFTELRLRYRYYTQSSSFFWRRSNMHAGNPSYVTADPKMAPMHDQTVGLKVRLSLDFLSLTTLNFMRSAVLDWNVDYIFDNTSRYGPWGLIAQGGVSWDF